MGTTKQARAAARHKAEHVGAVQIDDEAATLDAQLGGRAVRVVFEADGGVWLTLRRRTPAGWVGVSLDLDDVFTVEPLPEPRGQVLAFPSPSPRLPEAA